jgi:hypothetical protein
MKIERVFSDGTEQRVLRRNDIVRERGKRGG